MRILVWLSLGCFGTSVAFGGEAEARRFREQVAPILQGHCVRCHEGKKPKGDVDLTKGSGVVNGVGEGWVIVPGKPEESRLFEVISGEKPTMPKSGDRLSPDQVETIRSWIADGAAWPAGEVLRQRPEISSPFGRICDSMAS